MTDTKKTITLERSYQASLEDIWALWTTKEGLESWWGPEGFCIEVRTLDIRPGGLWEYAMIATAQEQIEFMKKAEMPLSTEQRCTYTHVVTRQRLAYDSLVDFIPGVAAYAAATWVEFQQSEPGVKMVLTLDAMHDSQWTDMARMGWESQLGKLAKMFGR